MRIPVSSAVSELGLPSPIAITGAHGNSPTESQPQKGPCIRTLLGRTSRYGQGTHEDFRASQTQITVDDTIPDVFTVKDYLRPASQLQPNNAGRSIPTHQIQVGG